MKSFFTVAGTAVLCIFALHSNSQSNFADDVYYNSNITLETGMSLGGMSCLTDLGNGKTKKKYLPDANLGNTQLCGSIYFTTYYQNFIGLRAEAMWGAVKAQDYKYTAVEQSKNVTVSRNLSFRSSIFELSATVEIHPLYYKKFTTKDKLPRISPFIMAGVGFFVFNPTAKFNGQWVDLQPLHTEGQGFAEYPNRKPYKLKQFNFPVGTGIRYKIMENVSFTTEFVYRFLNTDYLDDVSTSYIDKSLFAKYLNPGLATKAAALFDRQKEINPNVTSTNFDVRGNPEKKDSYYSVNFKIGLIF